MIHRAAGTFRRFRRFELGDDIVDARRFALNRTRYIFLAERTVALTVTRQVKIDERNLFSLCIAPDVDFRPCQERMNTDVHAARNVGRVAPPKFRGLSTHVPIATGRTRTEDALLGSRRLFVATDPTMTPAYCSRCKRRLS